MVHKPFVRIAAFVPAALFALTMTTAANAAETDECTGETFPSTFALIQKAIFENKGCNSLVCHSAGAATGNLDLSGDGAYDALVEHDTETVPGTKRVVPGRKDKSILYINLAAATLPDMWTAPLRPMPLEPVPPLTENELDAVRMWIEAGAPRDAVVAGVAELLDTCAPPLETPPKIAALPAPAPGTGVQIHMPVWTLAGESEHEVCFSSYYDVTDQVPAEFLTEDGKRFRYKRNEVRQDPLSHHLIVNLYLGNTVPTNRIWGTYKCRGGAKDGQSCSPLELNFCGADSGCAAWGQTSFDGDIEVPQIGVACIGYGPGDAGTGVMTAGFSGSQETASEFNFPTGVYGEIPLKGQLLWNSHAFNVFQNAGKLEAWLNFEFASPAEQQTPARTIFMADKIFAMNAPAFGTDEPCNIQQFPDNAHIYELSSHMHKRGKRFRTYRGEWTCEGGPDEGNPCSPFGVDLDSRQHCRESQCASKRPAPSGDCNLDGDISISELVSSVNIALGTADMGTCPDADGDASATVSINELVTAVNVALGAKPGRVARDPEESLLYVSTIYNDPVVLRYDPPMVLGPNLNQKDRSFTFCALYDNGFTNPADVKRQSTSPDPPIEFPGIGGPCELATHCTDGKAGQPCTGTGAAARNASCDTTEGAGDGMCDACPLRGGVTTEDEMFILMGGFYVP